MKNYTITVNGVEYQVTVEDGSTTPKAITPKVVTPVVPKATEAPKATKSSGSQGSVKIEAGAAGKIFKIEASVGQAIKRGDTVIVLEAMKMEIPVVAPQDGTIASIDVTVGQAVEAGEVLATLE